jgi:hypothetical protein
LSGLPDQDPVEQPASEVDTCHGAAVVAGEEAALSLERAAGVLVRVSGQQADRLVEVDAVRAGVDIETTAKPRSGTMSSSANWPFADPPGPAVRTPSTSRRNQPMPMASPRLLPRNAAVGSFIACSISAGRDAGTAVRAAIAELEPGPAQLVGDRGREASAGVFATPAPPQPRDRDRSVLAAVVPHREPAGHDVIAREEAV